MNIIEQSRPQPSAIPGIAHATWAAREEGLSQMSVWRSSMAPGAATPPHRHDCDEVVLCLAGRGEAHGEGLVRPFGAGATLVLPKGRFHQIVSTGNEPLEIIAVLAATPVNVELPDGAALELPWRS